MKNEYVKLGVLLTLGQIQYVSRPLTNACPDELPNLGEGIRYTDSCNDYHSIKIHRDDALLYAERYIDWKNGNSPFPIDKQKALDEIRRNIEKEA